MDQSPSTIATTDRQARHGHRSAVVWLTGLPGAGKSTIAYGLEAYLFSRDYHACVLDGDALRRGLCSDLGYSPEARTENIRRAGEVAAILKDLGMVVIAAFVSPVRADRERVRRTVGERFIEVYVNAPLSICEERDPKRLYAKARSGQLPDFTGISAPYEPPENPEIEVRTDTLTIQASIERIADHLCGVIRLDRRS